MIAINMAELFRSASESRPVGVTESGIIDIPDDQEILKIAAARDAWMDNGEEILKVTVDLSLDGGQRWILGWVGFGARGGIHIHRDLTPSTESSVVVKLPPGRNRKIRIAWERRALLTTSLRLESARLSTP